MKQPICAVFDKKTALYGQPISTVHVGEAIREFNRIAKDPNTKWGMNPEDFDLKQIGWYDLDSGELTTVSPPMHLASGLPNGSLQSI